MKTTTSLLFLLSVCLAGTVYASGPDYIREHDPIEDARDDSAGLLTHGFDHEHYQPRTFRRFKEQMKDLPPFWRDTGLILKPRSFYFNRNQDGTDNNAETWTGGGALDYHSGWLADRLRLAGILYTSQKLYGPENKDGSLLLKPGQKSFTVLGEAFAELKLAEELHIRVGRSGLRLPYINLRDNRMIPNSFETYGIGGLVIPHLRMIVTHVLRMRNRNDDEFRSMSKIAGVKGRSKPVTVAGARYAFADDVNIGAMTIYGWDFMNTFYAEGNTRWDVSEDLALAFSAQYTDQRSVGADLLGDFETSVWGARLTATYGGLTGSMAFSTTDNDATIRSPFGSYAGYLSLMVQDFFRAGEDAWLVGLSYDFANLGIPGLSAFTNYAKGYTDDSGKRASPDQSELDITVDYRPPAPIFQGLWLRVRHARVNQDGKSGVDKRDWRIILNFEVPLL